MSKAREYRIAVVPGDGIGKEVVPEGVRVLEAAAARFGFALRLDEMDFASCDYYRRHGRMMPEDWRARIGGHDAIFFGAVGWPEIVPDHVSLWGSLIQFRRAFDQYVNLRPVRLMPGVPCPLAGRKPGDIDFYVVRENTEGEYSSIGGRMFADTEREFVVQETVMTRTGVDRILRFAFGLARSRDKKHLTSATKSNGISITMPYWDERVEAIAKSFPEVRWDKYHIDILVAHFVRNPHFFDVVQARVVSLPGRLPPETGPARASLADLPSSAALMLLLAGNVRLLLEQIADPKLLHQHKDDDGERRREQHAERAEENGEADDREYRQRRRKLHRALLDERRDQIAFELLHKHKEADDPERRHRPLGQPDGYGGSGAQDRSKKRDELQQPGDKSEREGGGDSDQPQPDRDERPDENHRGELPDQPELQGAADGVERLGRLGPARPGDKDQQTVPVEPGADRHVDAGDQHKQDIRKSSQNPGGIAEDAHREPAVFGKVLCAPSYPFLGVDNPVSLLRNAQKLRHPLREVGHLGLQLRSEHGGKATEHHGNEHAGHRQRRGIAERCVIADEF